MNFDIAMTEDINVMARAHLLSFLTKGQLQEDLCFALWTPSTGAGRVTAVLNQVILPDHNERLLHGGASFIPSYMSRAVRLAVREKKGLAFMHSHPSPGWQGMSAEDVVAERDVIGPPAGATGLPLVGLTIGTDGYWSARFWSKDQSSMRRNWCTKVRVVGESKYSVYFNDHIASIPKRRNVLRRTYDTWGPVAQNTISRLHIGIVGIGSVGCIVAEAVARMGVREITLVDHDVIKEHNLDRLLFASEEDIGRQKVEAAAEFVMSHATAENPNVRDIALPIHHHSAYKAILDCDAIFSCVDRPVGRDVLNYVCQAHLIPVIDGGVAIETHLERKKFLSAHWRAHLCTPLHRCLRCLGQYSTGMVVTELDGSLDDPSYINNLPRGTLPRNENVFPFSLSTAAMQVNLLLRYILSESWWPVVHQQDFQFVLSKLEAINGKCNKHCSFNAMQCWGDDARPPYLMDEIVTEEKLNQRNIFMLTLQAWLRWSSRFLYSVFGRGRH